jgi:hypothetical protein
MTFAVLNKPHEWVAAGLFVLFGLFASLMAWRTWHGEPPLPVRARSSSADFVFGVNTFGRFRVGESSYCLSFSNTARFLDDRPFQ